MTLDGKCAAPLTGARAVPAASGQRLGQREGVVLGQRCVEEKLNEINAIPELMEGLAL